MTKRDLKNSIPADYPSLLIRVKNTLIEGQRRIEAERVKIYWETGRLIQDHVLKHNHRAEYGAQVLGRLSADLNVSKTVLTRCIQFARKYPRLSIVAGRQQFSWSHYRELITIPDDKKRSLFEKAAGRNFWSSEELAARIKEKRPEPQEKVPSKSPQQTPLTPLRGELYTYQIVERPAFGIEEPALLLDLGFGVFRNVESRLLSNFSAKDIVESRPKEDSYRFYKTDHTAKDLYTYRAFIEKVIDGDTLKVRFDLGFDTWVRQILRLRGIDCPEMDTKEGQAAKAFVQSYIKEAQLVIVRSSRSDKYDRYLADIFILKADSKDSKDATNQKDSKNPTSPKDSNDDIYLNNLLLEKQFARRMD